MRTRRANRSHRRRRRNKRARRLSRRLILFFFHRLKINNINHRSRTTTNKHQTRTNGKDDRTRSNSGTLQLSTSLLDSNASYERRNKPRSASHETRPQRSTNKRTLGNSYNLQHRSEDRAIQRRHRATRIESGIRRRTSTNSRRRNKPERALSSSLFVYRVRRRRSSYRDGKSRASVPLRGNTNRSRNRGTRRHSSLLLNRHKGTLFFLILELFSPRTLRRGRSGGKRRSNNSNHMSRNIYLVFNSTLLANRIMSRSTFQHSKKRPTYRKASLASHHRRSKIVTDTLTRQRTRYYNSTRHQRATKTSNHSSMTSRMRSSQDSNRVTTKRTRGLFYNRLRHAIINDSNTRRQSTRRRSRNTKTRPFSSLEIYMANHQAGGNYNRGNSRASILFRHRTSYSTNGRRSRKGRYGAVTRGGYLLLFFLHVTLRRGASGLFTTVRRFYRAV